MGKTWLTAAVKGRNLEFGAVACEYEYVALFQVPQSHQSKQRKCKKLEAAMDIRIKMRTNRDERERTNVDKGVVFGGPATAS